MNKKITQRKSIIRIIFLLWHVLTVTSKTQSIIMQTVLQHIVVSAKGRAAIAVSVA